MRNPKWSIIGAGIAIAGVIGTAIFVALETPMANYRLDEAKKQKENEEPLTLAESAKIMVPSYKKSIAAAAAAITAIILTNRFDKKIIVGLAGAAIAKDKAFSEFKTQTKKIVGEDTYNDIVKSIAEKKYEFKQNLAWNVVPCKSYDIFTPGEGKQMYYLDFIDDCPVFWLTPEQYLDAKYHFNRNFVGRQVAFVSEFLEFLGFPPNIYEKYDYEGWNMDEFLEDGIEPPWIDFCEKEVTRDNNETLTIVSCMWDPMMDPESYWERDV